MKGPKNPLRSRGSKRRAATLRFGRLKRSAILLQAVARQRRYAKMYQEAVLSATRFLARV